MVRETNASGHEALLLAVELLHRVRLADPHAGLWEAADVCWWWRTSRASDSVATTFWMDDDGPVAGVLVTAWRPDRWQVDPVVVPGVEGPSIEVVWARALELLSQHAVGGIEIGVHGADAALHRMVVASGFAVDDLSASAWMAVADRVAPRAVPAGLVVVDRVTGAATPHPMRALNGDGVGDRLAKTPLYSPDLDLTFETADGRQTGYVLGWYDEVTRVGMVEPVRTFDEFRGQGLAGALISIALERLAAKGAERFKIGWGEEPAASIYQALGFRKTSDDTYYVSRA